MASLDWSQCPAAESMPDRRSGVWDSGIPIPGYRRDKTRREMSSGAFPEPSESSTRAWSGIARAERYRVRAVSWPAPRWNIFRLISGQNSLSTCDIASVPTCSSRSSVASAAVRLSG
jgi:hypothetical protein